MNSSSGRRFSAPRAASVTRPVHHSGHPNSFGVRNGCINTSQTKHGHNKSVFSCRAHDIGNGDASATGAVQGTSVSYVAMMCFLMTIRNFRIILLRCAVLVPSYCVVWCMSLISGCRKNCTASANIHRTLCTAGHECLFHLKFFCLEYM